MPSNPAQPALVPHPIVTAAANVPQDCTITVYFRTFNPGDGTFPPLANAPVTLVCSDPAKSVAGKTDATGKLCGTGPPGTAFVVPHIESLAAETFHFEVDLNGLSYADGPGSTPFPVAKWQTKGWQEPEGHWGQFSLTGPLFPVDPNQSCWFTIGCYVNVPLIFMNDERVLAPYPANIELRLGPETSPSALLNIRPGGVLSDAIFTVPAGGTVGLLGYFKASAIPVDKIRRVIGGMVLGTDDYKCVPGEMFGLSKIPKAHTVCLYSTNSFSTSLLPALVPTSVNKNVQYVAHVAYKANDYQAMPVNEILAVAFNWFIGFVADRNLFHRAIKIMLADAAQFLWSDLPNLTLRMERGSGGIYATSGQIIYCQLDFMLKPRRGSVFHESGHNLIEKYFPNVSTKIYFPNITTDHDMGTYSHEFFAFKEGFPEFIASMFVSAQVRFEVERNSSWKELFDFQFAGSTTSYKDYYRIKFGYYGGLLTGVNLEPSAGMAIEGAFCAALRVLWEEHILSQHTPAVVDSWIKDPNGDGTLDLTVNAWLLDTNVNKMLARLIFDAVKEAANDAILGSISSRRVMDRIEKLISANTSWTGIAVSDLASRFVEFRVISGFHVSSISNASIASSERLVSRSKSNSLEYRTADSTAVPLSSGTGGTLKLKGVRFPTQSLGMTVELVGGGTSSAVTITAASELDADANFSGGGSIAQGDYDLLVSAGGSQQLIAGAVQVVT